jgi:hypothetical protein
VACVGAGLGPHAGDDGALVLEDADPVGDHQFGESGAAVLGCDVPCGQARAGDGTAAEVLGDEDPEPSGDDGPVAQGDAGDGMFAQSGDVLDAVTVAAGGQGVELLPLAVVGRGEEALLSRISVSA